MPIQTNLVDRALQHFPGGCRPTRNKLTRWLQNDEQLSFAIDGLETEPPKVLPGRPEMSPANAIRDVWCVPAIVTIDELASFFKISNEHLFWMADGREWNGGRQREPLRHYHYRWQKKRSGFWRLIEAPKWQLKQIQRKILRRVLDHAPPNHAAHGFRRGRSVESFVQPHTEQRVVMRIDMEDFFPSIGRNRVVRLFMLMGYPEAISKLLAGLCTNIAPSELWDDLGTALSSHEMARTHSLYDLPHLPQGAPTSPAIANLIANRLDARLQGLADSARLQYTRYADDLVFSGDHHLLKSAESFHVYVSSIILEEGFRINPRKTRIMASAQRQRVAGLIVNKGPNIDRREYDALKATLFNCVRHSPKSQNHRRVNDFRAHLIGRVAYVERISPQRGQKLQALLSRIDWSDRE